MKPRNPTLYRNLKQFTEEAISLLQETVASAKDIPKRPAYKLQTRKERGWSITQAEKAEWGLLIYSHEPQLVQLDSHASCMRLLQADTVIAPHLGKLVGIHGGSASAVQTSRILPRFISSLLYESESLSPNQEQFDALYERLEDFFYSRELNMRLIAPLINMTGPLEPTLLTDDVYMAPNSVNRLEQWFRTASEGFSPIPWHGVLELTHSLEHQFSAPKVIRDTTPPSAQETQAHVAQSPFAVAVSKIKRMVSALRLLKHDYVAVPFVEHELVEWHPITLGGRQAPLYPPPWRFFGPRYLLVQESDVSEIAALYKALSHELLGRHRFINVAVQRIERSVEETEHAERLVDLVIALEALLLADIGPADLRGELGFRLSLRGAYFLASDAAQRRNIYQELKKAYRLRSAIVHGDELPRQVTIFSQRIPIKEFVNRIENHTREAAKRMLLLATQPNATRELVKWDDLVIGATGFN